MQITIANAQEYSMKGERAFELTYSNGIKVRAVESAGGWIRKEGKEVGGEWKLSGKPYVVKADKKRAAERIKSMVLNFLKGK